MTVKILLYHFIFGDGSKISHMGGSNRKGGDVSLLFWPNFPNCTKMKNILDRRGASLAHPRLGSANDFLWKIGQKMSGQHFGGGVWFWFLFEELCHRRIRTACSREGTLYLAKNAKKNFFYSIDFFLKMTEQFFLFVCYSHT